MTLKAITIAQPWATLVAIGAKKLETRSWGTLYRGKLAIHASPSFPKAAQDLLHTEPFYTILSLGGVKNSSQLIRGAIIAIVNLWDCRMILNHRMPPEPEYSFSDFKIGKYVWCFEDAELLQNPMEHQGGDGLWDFTPEIRV